MPLLSFLQKKSKQTSLLSTNSNTSSNDDDYVNVSIPSPLSDFHHSPASSGRLGLPFRHKKQDTLKPSHDALLEPPPRQSSLFQAYQDHHHDYRPGVSTQSLPAQVEKRQLRPDVTPQQRPTNPSSKKSLFTWSSKQKSSSAGASKSLSHGELSDDASFNLKSFRHIRPDSPSFTNSSVGRHTPSPPPRPPIPTTALPGRESAFEVTSRRPRGNSTATNINSTTAAAVPTTSASVPPINVSSLTQSQQKIAVSAFRQAARRSVASLSPSDSSPCLSPIRTSLDDRLSVPALSFNDSNEQKGTTTVTTPPRPPRSQPPGPAPRPATGASKSTFTTKAAQAKTGHAFGDSDTSDTSDEDDDEDGDSGAEGIPSGGASRKRTIRGKPPAVSPPAPPERDSFGSKLGIPYLDLGGELGASFTDNLFSSPVDRPDPVRTWTPPIPVKPRADSYSASDNTLANIKKDGFLGVNATRDSLTSSVMSQSQIRTQDKSATTDNIPRPPSSLSVYSTGTRKRASLSVGALDASAKEARASVLLTANARLSTASTVMLATLDPAGDAVETSSLGSGASQTPRPTSRPLNSTFSRSPPQARRSRVDSDTSESSSASSSSSEDAPLSKLLPPRRPGTTLSSHSDSSPVRKPIQLLQSNSSSSLPHPSSGRKPLVDLSAPSSLTGRPIGVPPPPSREEETTGRRKSRLSIDTGFSVNTARTAVNPRTSMADDTSPISGRSSSSVPRPSINARLQSVAVNASAENAHQHSRRPHASSPPTTIPRVSPPMPPFLRRESPASSTGDSSSGKAPYTPRDGSRPASLVSASVGGGRDRESKVGHGRKPSVTFEDELDGGVTVKGRGGKTMEKVKDKALGKERSGVATNQIEERRKERRRSEARAAIELGKVVNGPPPVDPDDEPVQAAGNPTGMMTGMSMQPGGGTWPPQMQMQMLNPGGMPAAMLSPQTMQMQMLSPHSQMQQMQMMSSPQMMPMMNPMNTLSVSPMMLGAQGNSFPFPGAGGSSMPGTPGAPTSPIQQSGQPVPNEAFLAAHHQAMAIAKQTFQMAVAQQALAAANDEWERGSAMTGFGGGSQWGGISMGMAPPTAMRMFPPAPRSMYAGSVGGGGAGGAWGGTGSVYGGTFGPQAVGGVKDSQVPGDRSTRQRTKTAPSSQNPPKVSGGHGGAGKKMPPPSSYKGTR